MAFAKENTEELGEWLKTEGFESKIFESFANIYTLDTKCQTTLTCRFLVHCLNFTEILVQLGAKRGKAFQLY